LWLGISGVGSIVVISTFLLISGVPARLLPSTSNWKAADVTSLLTVIGCWVAVMVPLDLLGGFLLPNRSRPGTVKVTRFLSQWIRGVFVQAAAFLLFSLFVLVLGRWLGLMGAAIGVFCIAVLLIAFQLHVARLVAKLPMLVGGQRAELAAIDSAVKRVSELGYKPRPILVLKHHDTGFTGGIVGLPGMESIIIPSCALNALNADQLTAMVARRLEAIQSGARTRGVLFSLCWVTFGFVVSASLPNARVISVAGLAMTACGFTIWTFLGLLILPTLSRQSAYAIDRKVVQQGVLSGSLQEAVQTMDQMQDDEPSRSKFIEAIFHPVPSAANRGLESKSTFPIAWHAARMTLFVSWACTGMLVRAVHCNAGRPELWVMLPTD
jgi:hypothetical protein